MAKFILDGQEYGGGGSGNQIVKLTQAEYDALSNDKLSNNTIYLITDSGELAAENLFYDGSQTGLGNNVQDAIDELNSNLIQLKKINASISVSAGAWSYVSYNEIKSNYLEESETIIAVIPSVYNGSSDTSKVLCVIDDENSQIAIKNTHTGNQTFKYCLLIFYK